MKKYIKKHYFIIFYLLTLSLLWIIYTFNDRLQYLPIRQVVHENIQTNNSYIEKINSPIKDVEINFEIKIDPKSPTNEIIKTGLNKNSLLLKFTQPSSLQIHTGYNNPEGKKMYALTDTYDFHRSHTIKIKIIKDKQLRILYDDVLIINSYDKNTNTDISHFQVGNYFKNKNTGSSLKNINYSYTLYRDAAVTTILKTLLYLLFIVLNVLLIRKNIRFLSRAEKINYTIFILLCGFIMGIVYQIGQRLLGYSYERTTFLFRQGNMLGDFIEPVKNPVIITYSFFTGVVKLIFYHIDMEMTLTLFILMSGITLTLINLREIGNNKLNISSLIKVVVFSATSYVVLFTINRGNFEIIVFFLIYGFSSFIDDKKYVKSSIFLSFAIAMKIFPAVLLVVLISYRKYRAAMYAILLSLFLNLTSFVITLGITGKSISKIIADYLAPYTGGYIREYVIDNRGLDYGHTLYGLLKLQIFRSHHSAIMSDITLKKVLELYNYYSRLQIGMFGLFSAYVIFIEKELWKKITLMIIAMDLLPFVSADYKLIHFFIPLYLLINKSKKSRADFFYIILFGLILIPKNYYTVLLRLPDTSLSIFLTPVFMIVLASFIIYEGSMNFFMKNYFPLLSKTKE